MEILFEQKTITCMFFEFGMRFGVERVRDLCDIRQLVAHTS